MGLYAMALYATAEAAFAKLFPKTIERFRTEPGVVYYHAEEVFDSFIAGYNFGRCELIDENTALRTSAETAERERDDARAEVEQSAELERERILRHVHRSLLNMSKAACRKDATPDEMRAYRTVALMVDSLTEQIDRLDHHRDGGG